MQSIVSRTRCAVGVFGVYKALSNGIRIEVGCSERKLQGRVRRKHIAAFSSVRDDSAVRILEVGARDGLQNIKQHVSTPVKIELIQRLAAAGLKNIEATSFVSPKWIPQLADAAEVFSQVSSLAEQKQVNLPVLVPNLKGLSRALENGAKEVVVFVSASEGFSQKNTSCSVDEALARAKEVAEHALKQKVAVRGVISCIFACPYDGPTEPIAVLRIAKQLLQMGCYEVGLGDTLGVGTPSDVEKLLRVLLVDIPAKQLAGHFHDTYGQAVANVAKAYDMGLRAFDSSIAGLGGCPYAKGAKGNVATEDIVYTFENSGIPTGIDLDALVSTGEWISQHLGQPNGSRAGSALVAKRTPKENSRSTKYSDEDSPSIEWNVFEDNGEYTVSRAGNAVKVTLTRPKNGNAMTTSMVEGLTKLFTSLAQDSNVFHIVLAAEGRFFCTGMDLSASGSTNTSDMSIKSEYYQKVVNMFSAIDNAPQTTIATIDGPCFGGGVGLAFACDIRLVSSQARFTMTEIKLGLVPAIISKYMIREWGVSFLREAMISGREVKADELRRIGAIHGLVDSSNALERLEAHYISKLGRCAPRSASVCKNLVKLGWRDPGGKTQSEAIKQAFEQMMLPGSEGFYGLEQFRKKVKTVDWAQYWTDRADVRL